MYTTTYPSACFFFFLFFFVVFFWDLRVKRGDYSRVAEEMGGEKGAGSQELIEHCTFGALRRPQKHLLATHSF